MPWEAVEFPFCLDILPPPLDIPANYYAKRNPIDEETRKLLKERNDYMQSVTDHEKEIDSDGNLDCYGGFNYFIDFLKHVSIHLRNVSAKFVCKGFLLLNHNKRCSHFPLGCFTFKQYTLTPSDFCRSPVSSSDIGCINIDPTVSTLAPIFPSHSSP